MNTRTVKNIVVDKGNEFGSTCNRETDENAKQKQYARRYGNSRPLLRKNLARIAISRDIQFR